MTIKYLDSKRISAPSSDLVQGNNGGSGTSDAYYAGGGGGGAGGIGAAGISATPSFGTGGSGGAGLSSTILDNSIDWHAGGGGGGGHYAGGRGQSGGGDGTNNSSGADGGNGSAGSGSGGGGCSYNGDTNGGAGGSGVVILRFTTSGNTYGQVGGAVTTVDSDTVIKYTATSGTTFTPSSAFNVEYLVIAGGGGGGGCANNTYGSAGGGAGGYRTSRGHGVTAQAYTITVGAGGAGGISANDGTNGNNSVFDTITSTGGGGGAEGNTGNIGLSGGSGGGGSYISSGGAVTNLTPTNVQDGTIIVKKNKGERIMFNQYPTSIGGGEWVSDYGYPSMYESFNTVNKQHFVEWFSGNDLDSIWDKTVVGSSTGVMDDSVDGGYLITTGTSNDDLVQLDFADKKQYSHNGSEVIAVWKGGKSGSTFENISVGLMSATYALTGVNQAGWVLDNSISSNTYFMKSGNASGVQYLWTSVPYDTNFHVFKSSLSASGMTGSIDGVAVGTTTTNLPTGSMQPHIHRQYKSSDSVARILNVRYFEAYNT